MEPTLVDKVIAALQAIVDDPTAGDSHVTHWRLDEVDTVLQEMIDKVLEDIRNENTKRASRFPEGPVL